MVQNKIRLHKGYFKNFPNEDKRKNEDLGFDRIAYYKRTFLNSQESVMITKKDQIVMRLIQHYLKNVNRSITLTDLKEYLQSTMQQPSYSMYHLKYVLMFLRLNYKIKWYVKKTKTGMFAQIIKWNYKSKK